MRIALGIHGTDVVGTALYFNHLAAFAEWAKSYEMLLIGLENDKVASARRRIVDTALREGCTHWLSLDTDHAVLDSLLPLLLESAETYAAVSGLICKRGFPFQQVAFRLVNEEFEAVHIGLAAGVVEVDACAFGCTLVNLAAIQARGIPLPWFADGRERSDMNFCRLLRANGLRIAVDARVRVRHRLPGQFVGPEDADDFRAAYLAAQRRNEA